MLENDRIDSSIIKLVAVEQQIDSLTTPLSSKYALASQVFVETVSSLGGIRGVLLKPGLPKQVKACPGPPLTGNPGTHWVASEEERP